MFNKYFTLQEANDLLPSVREELVHLQSLERECKTVHHHLQAVKKGALEEVNSRQEDIFLLETAVDFLEIQAQSYVSQLEKTGFISKVLMKGWLISLQK
ncbi:Uncharacterized conserved protein [Alteribacillus bidgolensis]|uniref:Uncharacterized conserved protein n=1 Tax=Alteribacillus bidgolensis TaxID=930129 RepID=A0A1G8CCC7_9BACI|nr:DUF2203 family protein [Alteribacillus bidgolensis]SDH43082.1 Uncharacterized conserved protein [Alteribacillus bidgolensis]